MWFCTLLIKLNTKRLNLKKNTSYVLVHVSFFFETKSRYIALIDLELTNVNQTGLLIDGPASAYQVLELKACATSSCSYFKLDSRYIEEIKKYKLTLFSLIYPKYRVSGMAQKVAVHATKPEDSVTSLCITWWRRERIPTACSLTSTQVTWQR